MEMMSRISKGLLGVAGCTVHPEFGCSGCGHFIRSSGSVILRMYLKKFNNAQGQRYYGTTWAEEAEEAKHLFN